MSDVYVVRNQLGHYWGKAKEWVDGREPRTVMRVSHADEALNTLVELNSRDIDLRGEVVDVPVNDRGEIIIEPSAHLIVQPGPPEGIAGDTVKDEPEETTTEAEPAALSKRG